MNIRIERRDNAHGTNLADKDQTVIKVSWPGGSELIGRWTLLCLPGGHIRADKATDAQIKEALMSDESTYA